MVKDSSSPRFARSSPEPQAVVVSAQVDLSLTLPKLLTSSCKYCNLRRLRLNSGTHCASGSSMKDCFSTSTSLDSKLELASRRLALSNDWMVDKTSLTELSIFSWYSRRRFRCSVRISVFLLCTCCNSFSKIFFLVSMAVRSCKTISIKPIIKF